MTDKYMMYGAPISLYTGKLRSYLIQKAIPYEEVFSSLRVYKNVIIPETGVRFIPVLKTPQGQYWQDTADIIESLEQRFPAMPALPATPKQGLVSLLFEMWADEWLLIPAMHYRWNKDNFPYIFEEFGRVVLPRGPAFLRRFIGKRIGSKFRGFVPILGINEETIPAIEDWFENTVLSSLDQHFASYPYLLGNTPTLGDYGLVGPLYAHLYMDPAPKKLLESKAPHVVAWLKRMQMAPTNIGNLVADDAIPDTLIPLLKDVFEQFWPVVESTNVAMGQWRNDNVSSASIPRTIGNHAFSINGVQSSRAILTFHQWKAQRVKTFYAQIPTIERDNIDAFLTQVGGLDCMQQEMTCKVKRQNNKLVFADTEATHV